MACSSRWRAGVASLLHEPAASRSGGDRDRRKEAPPVDDKYLIVILVLAILFGASRLSSLGRNLGQGIQEFRKGLTEGDREPWPPSRQPPDDGEPVR
jgi:TatA/E family protein of Tat protein translocase